MAALIKHAPESGRFYTKAGDPVLEITGLNGKPRRPDIRDARRLDLVPSVTNVLGIAAKPGLERWKQDQLLLAAATVPKLIEHVESCPDSALVDLPECPTCEGKQESADAWVKRVKIDAEAYSQQAREQGTDVHALIQGYFEHEPQPASEAMIGRAIEEALESVYPGRRWIAERSFATTDPLPYGGKVDLHADGVVVDLKGKDSIAVDLRRLTWPEQALQLAAYARGLGMPDAKLVNVYFEREDPRRCRVYEWPAGTWWERFEALLRFWHLSNAEPGL